MSQATMDLPHAGETTVDARIRRRAIVTFAPFIATYLIGATGNPVAPAFFVIFAAIISTITILLMKDRTNAPLD